MVKTRFQKNFIKQQISTFDGLIDTEMFIGSNPTTGVILFPADPNWDATMYSQPISTIFDECVEKDISVFRFTFLPYQTFNDIFDPYIAQCAVCVEFFFQEIVVKKNLTKIWNVGFSFGSLLALNICLRRPEIQNFIMISPPLTMYDFISWIHSDKKNGVLIFGTKDEIIPENLFEEYINLLKFKKMQMSFRSIVGANHVFLGREKNLASEILQFIMN